MINPNLLEPNLAKLLGEGNLAAAELGSCIMLQNNSPMWRQALGVRASISAAAGFWEYAERFITAQGFKTANEAQCFLNNSYHKVGRRRAKDKFLVAISWGCGLWSDLNHVLGCALIAKLTGRKLIVHWGKNSLYTQGQNEGFSSFFENFESGSLFDFIHSKYIGPENFGTPVLSRTITRTPTLIDMLRSHDDIFVSDRYIGVVNAMAWAPNCLWPDKNKIASQYRRLSANYLRPNDLLKNNVKKFIAKQFNGLPFAAIHIRGTDKRNDVPDLEELNSKSIDALHNIDPSLKIFAMTDDANILSKLHRLFPGRIISTNAVRSSNNDPIHIKKDRLSGICEPSPWIPGNLSYSARLGFEILLDTYIAIEAVSFIGNGQSNVSASIALIKDWPPDKCVLFGPNQLLEHINWGITV